MKNKKNNSNKNISKRIQWLIENRIGLFLLELQTKEKLSLDANKALEYLSQADPNKNNSNIQWILESYCRKGFLWEDLSAGKDSKVWETLNLFEKYKKHLTIEQRNIYNYQTLANLYSSVQPYHLAELEKTQTLKGTLEGQALKRWEKQKALENTLFLVDNKEYKVVVPLTQAASEWWGKGTRWCTAAKNNNLFDWYDKRSPLIIVIFKDSDNNLHKVQICTIENKYQFMDETDAPITVDFVKQYWNRFQTVIFYAFKINVDFWKYIPENFRTDLIYQRMVEKNGKLLSVIPELSRNLNLCWIAFEQYNYCFEHIPQYIQTVDLCTTAVKKNGLLLKYIGDSFKNYNVCMIACKQNGLALEFVPDKFKTVKILNTSVQQTGLALKFVPILLKTKELCQLAVQETGLALEHTPLMFIDKNLCMQACEKTGKALVFVPEQFESYELYLAAVKQDGMALKLIDDEFCTFSLYLAACEQTGSAISLVHEAIRNKKICLAACEQDGLSLYYVPERLKDQKLCQIAVENNGLALKFVPTDLKTEKLYTVAIKQAGNALHYIPKELRTYELCKIACSQNGTALMYVPESLKDLELCSLAINSNEQAIAYVPYHIGIIIDPVMQASKSWNATDLIALFNKKITVERFDHQQTKVKFIKKLMDNFYYMQDKLITFYKLYKLK